MGGLRQQWEVHGINIWKRWGREISNGVSE